jgi:hypothetical protein
MDRDVGLVGYARIAFFVMMAAQLLINSLFPSIRDVFAVSRG